MNDCLGKDFCSLRSKPLVLFTCEHGSMIFFPSKVIPTCFYDELSWTEMFFKNNIGWLGVFSRLDYLFY